jgi:hypothetical protein
VTYLSDANRYSSPAGARYGDCHRTVSTLHNHIGLTNALARAMHSVPGSGSGYSTPRIKTRESMFNPPDAGKKEPRCPSQPRPQQRPGC